ncbi:DUF5677 domain-containing protein [Paraburkholderia sediminicola]|uniref:DUF5677 domain-containing protein n=1 Tax=Paraburkholderia sediminicola TaxID=458836 RepID=UPI0038B77591
MEDFHIKGFLSPALNEQQQLAREKYAFEFHECDQWSDRAVALLAELGTSGEGVAKLFAGCYWMRCVRACQGGILLAERGMMPDALTLLRSAVESLFHAVALVNNPNLWERLAEHDMAERAKQAKGVLAIETIMRHVSPGDREKLEALKARGAEKLRPFHAYDAAQAAGLLELYETMFRGFSRDAAHSTLSALDHEFEAKPDGSITPSFGPCYEHLTWTLEMIAQCLKIGVERLTGRVA